MASPADTARKRQLILQIRNRLEQGWTGIYEIFAMGVTHSQWRRWRRVELADAKTEGWGKHIRFRL